MMVFRVRKQHKETSESDKEGKGKRKLRKKENSNINNENTIHQKQEYFYPFYSESFVESQLKTRSSVI